MTATILNPMLAGTNEIRGRIALLSTDKFRDFKGIIKFIDIYSL